MNNKAMKFKLNDYADPKRPVKKGWLEIAPNGAGLFIHVDGYGDKCSKDGSGLVVGLDYFEGKLTVRVWADINNENATHNIDLEGASENKRTAVCEFCSTFE